MVIRPVLWRLVLWGLEMGDKEKVSVKLKVMEAKEQKDIGVKQARISSDTMNKLGITVGDVIEIKGKKTTVKSNKMIKQKKKIEKAIAV